MRQKNSTLRSLQKEFSSLKVSLQNELNLIDFAHVSTLFFGINDKILKSKISVQQKKFYKLQQENKIENDPEKVIFNFSKYVLFDTEKKLLAKDLNFCLPPKQLKYADYLVHFELFYRDIRNLEILPNEDLDFAKTKTKETALSSFRPYNKNPQQNLSREELAALTNLGKNKDIVIQKSDNGNSAVIVDKDTYIKRMENLLSDQRKFEKVTLKNGYPENFIDKCFEKFLNNVHLVKENVPTVEKKRLLLVLPYLGIISLQTRTKLQQALKGGLNCCKLQIVFKCQARLSNSFRYKDPIPKDLISGVVYKFQCGLCNESYYVESIRHLDIRSGEHIGVSPLTGKKVKPSNNSAICDHLLHCNFLPSFDNFSVLAYESKKYLLEIKESLLIMRDKPSLNRYINSAPLYLFDKVS